MSRFVLPFANVFDALGEPMPGGKLYFYASGTTTAYPTYSNSGRTIANSNPVVADAAGRFSDIYLADALYKVVLKTAADVVTWTADPVAGYSSTTEALIEATLTSQQFTADGINASFTLTTAPSGVATLIVAIDGVVQLPSAYSLAGAIVTFTEIPPVSASIDVRVIARGVASVIGDTYTATGTGAVARTLGSKLSDIVSVKDFGAVGDGTTDDTNAFLAAEAVGSLLYVPAGTYKLTTPMALGYGKQYFGAGVLKFTNAEWWRNGGSAGVGVAEKYTLFYDYALTSDVTVTFDGVSQAITWIGSYTVQAPASSAGVNVKINIANGTLTLGEVPEAVRSYNMTGNGGSHLAPALPNATTSPTGMMNTAYGARAGRQITTGENNTALGCRALVSTTTGNNNTAVGFQAAYRTSGEQNTAVGSIAGEWLTTGGYNTLVGALCGSKLTTGTYNTAAGVDAFGSNDAGSYCVAIGHRSLSNPPSAGSTENTAVGAFAGDFVFGAKNSLLGYRAGCGPNGGSDGLENVFLGYFSGRNQNGADYNTAAGVSSLLALTSGQNNVAVGHSSLNAITTGDNAVAVGFEALKANTASSVTAVGYHALLANTSATGNTAVGNQALAAVVTAIDNTAVGEGALLLATGTSNTAVGARALGAQVAATNNVGVGYEAGRFLTTGSGNTFVGYRAGRATTTVADNVALGQDALQLNTTGTQNTALGRSALRLDQAAANQTTYDNTTGVGYSASVSGSNQVQLGNSATTTYAYGAVQARSDVRDKADVRDTELGAEFILSLRPVDYKWNYREDYSGASNDGSRKRQRYHHGLIAQEVREVCERLGVEFGGYQDHSIAGGCDVLSIGYSELIGPMIRTLQQQQAQMNQLAARLAELEG